LCLRISSKSVKDRFRSSGGCFSHLPLSLCFSPPSQLLSSGSPASCRFRSPGLRWAVFLVSAVREGFGQARRCMSTRVQHYARSPTGGGGGVDAVWKGVHATNDSGFFRSPGWEEGKRLAREERTTRGIKRGVGRPLATTRPLLPPRDGSWSLVVGFFRPPRPPSSDLPFFRPLS